MIRDSVGSHKSVVLGGNFESALLSFARESRRESLSLWPEKLSTNEIIFLLVECDLIEHYAVSLSTKTRPSILFFIPDR